MSHNALLTGEGQMQLLLLSPGMLARREDVLDILAALMPRCVTWSEQVLESVDVWNKDLRGLLVSATSVVYMYMKSHKQPEDRFNGDFLARVITLVPHVSVLPKMNGPGDVEAVNRARKFLNDGREVHVEVVIAGEEELLQNVGCNLPRP